MDLSSSYLKKAVERLKGKKELLGEQLKLARSSYVKAHRDLILSEKARSIIQIVAKNTQDNLRFHITGLGTMVLEAVFGKGMALDLTFEEKGGKTEASIRFKYEGSNGSTDPLEADSGGASDLAAFALRCSLWSMNRPKLRPLLVLDEPFKNINDPTREMHKKAAEMVKRISETLGIQFIIVTALPELEEVADKIIKL